MVVSSSSYGMSDPHRFFYGTRRGLALSSPGKPEVIVGTVAVQLGDGSIDDGSKIGSHQLAHLLNRAV
jgi:hypothetical protein